MDTLLPLSWNCICVSGFQGGAEGMGGKWGGGQSWSLTLEAGPGTEDLQGLWGPVKSWREEMED